MAIRNIAGQPVRGTNFFKRPGLLQQFKRKLDSGSSLLISAPRRVGKTSLMFHIHDEKLEGYHFIYLITESVNNENEFYKRILSKIFHAEFLTPLQRFAKKASQTIRDRASRISEFGNSVKIEKESQLDYRQEFIDILKAIDLEGQQIVLMIDEYSQTIENIIEDEGKSSALRFLQGSRELRQDPDIAQKVRFVFAGSIGLENIVNRLNAVNLVNDLDTLNVPPIDVDESHRLMRELCENLPFTLTKANREYILEKIQWYIPFYIQLAVQEITNLYYEKNGNNGPGKKRIAKKTIDGAFAQMLELRNCFEHWLTHLRKAFKKEDYSFAKELLNYISQNENISSGEIFNLAQKLTSADERKEIVKALVYDGYINNNDERDTFRFNSPLLREWWWNNVAY